MKYLNSGRGGIKKIRYDYGKTRLRSNVVYVK